LEKHHERRVAPTPVVEYQVVMAGEAEREEGRQKAHPSPLRTRLPVPAECAEL